MHIGVIEGYEVIYNEENDRLYCKDFIVPAEKMIQAYESGYDRNSIEGNLVMRKHDYEFTLGCLTITLDNGKQLIKQIKNARRIRNRNHEAN